MNMERIEQGMKLAMEIQMVEKKAVDFLRGSDGDASTLFILTAVQSFGKAVHDETMRFARRNIKENPELIDRLREEHGGEEQLENFINELNKPEAEGNPSADDVDFKPIQ